MRDVKRQFNEKVSEIEKYFELLEQIMIRNAKLVLPDGAIISIDSDLNKILRANVFLLLYNLVESSISQGIEEIYLHMVKVNLDYDQIRDTIKKEIILNLKKNVNADEFVSGVKEVAIHIIRYYPTKNTLFSGNVDAREVKNMAKKYGFSYATNTRKTNNGDKLLTVKSKRNDLAHGFISFQECGKDYSINEVIKIKNEVVAYVEQILDNIDHYLQNKGYESNRNTKN